MELAEDLSFHTLDPEAVTGTPTKQAVERGRACVANTTGRQGMGLVEKHWSCGATLRQR